MYFILYAIYNISLQLEPEDNGTEIMNALKYVRPGSGYVPNFNVFDMTQVNGKSEAAIYTFLKVGIMHACIVSTSGLFKIVRYSGLGT